jgi:hypothetical protein
MESEAYSVPQQTMIPPVRRPHVYVSSASIQTKSEYDGGVLCPESSSPYLTEVMSVRIAIATNRSSMSIQYPTNDTSSCYNSA